MQVTGLHREYIDGKATGKLFVKFDFDKTKYRVLNEFVYHIIIDAMSKSLEITPLWKDEIIIGVKEMVLTPIISHLAIMRQPWYDMVKNGTKPIESRASINQIDPYQKVHRGHIIYFKRSGNYPVDLQATVSHVEYFQDEKVEMELLERREELGIDIKYIASKSKAKYLSLFWIVDVKDIEPIPFKQIGQRSWIVDYIPEKWMTIPEAI